VSGVVFLPNKGSGAKARQGKARQNFPFINDNA
jgi:hypothetical protein